MDISLNKMLEDSFKKNWDSPALSNYNGITLCYKDVARRVEKLHIIFGICGIKRGDKIAICARNQANWGVVFIACVTYGAVPVPVLSEFKPANIEFIVNHSGSKALFVGTVAWESLTASHIPNVDNIIDLDEFIVMYAKDPKIPDTRNHLNELFGKKYPRSFRAEDVSYQREKSGEDLALISYTSGTNGFSRGVMIPYRALISNVLFAIQVEPAVRDTSDVVSILPLAHTLGLTFEFLFEMCVGAHVHFLTRVPSPSVIVKAFQEIKPAAIACVPLVMEKIYRNMLQPFVRKPGMRFLLRFPIVDKKIKVKIKKTLSNAFGGIFNEIVIGGAPLNREAERFFHRIGFRYAIGYGMTECSPLISFSSWNKTKLYSCGKPVSRMQVKIDSPDPLKITGEILVKGDNVMLGYYQNKEATKEAFTEDGWMRTGDLGVIDEDGYLFIKGRSKTMILGASGQNIYPEEIEGEINNMPYVAESLVISEGEKLIALIYPDFEAAAKDSVKDVLQKMKENIATVNSDMPSYIHLSEVRIMPEEFEKTPKRSIKRYLYQTDSLQK